jgi:hypothetical protein
MGWLVKAMRNGKMLGLRPKLICPAFCPSKHSASNQFVTESSTETISRLAMSLGLFRSSNKCYKELKKLFEKFRLFARNNKEHKASMPIG